ncbi:hypothetical protein JRI60_10665 [Archangium violaceum]|uniref:SitA5 family polymorphic toxin n=1 Tax=Archangium violaceum TaxID=83451 RepID=UPI00194DDD9B|nr:hypothetical protein [Archangium violaceum]QRN99443.1 hypothetical protein JRI60_10665 [Archangium violaceum]
MRPSWMAVALMLLAGCGTATHVVRLDTGQDKPLVFTPRDGQHFVRLRESEFKESLAELARDVRPGSLPTRRARELMFESWRQEVYLEWMGRRLVPDALDSRGFRLVSDEDELTRGYGRWCERRHERRDCFLLLRDTPSLDADGRYTLAMAIATDAVWSETKQALADMADPEMVRVGIVSAMAMYMMLWALPEPVSKGIAATLTAGLIAYLGIDTVWGLIGGWMRLVEEVERAKTFEELREAGERYGKVMGRHAARVFVLLATAAIGNTSGLAAKGPGLPGYSQAAVLAESQGGFRLVALGEVHSVAVSAEGTFSIALAPHAVAMSVRGTGAGNPPMPGPVTNEEGGGEGLKNIYNGVKNAPGYPPSFRGAQNGTTTHPVTDKALMEKLRQVEPGHWRKVYRDGWIGNDKVSLHYFESPSGKVFNFKIKRGWSNP